MPNFTMPKRTFDLLGFIFFGFGLVMLSVSLDLFGDKNISRYIPIAIILGGFSLLGLYINHARRHQQPLIPLNIFKTRTFSVGIAGNIATRLGTGCIPFLMPLMLQVGFGYPAIISGMMMAPMALGSILAKSFVTKILVKFSYRRTLFAITIIIGLMIAQFSLQSPNMSIYYLVIPLFLLGMVMSIQFTSMNTISLADLTDNNASSGNSVLAVTQQLAISFGIAVSASILGYFDTEKVGTTVDNFHYTFITVGIITLLSSFVFLLLDKHDGDNLTNKKKKAG